MRRLGHARPKLCALGSFAALTGYHRFRIRSRSRQDTSLLHRKMIVKLERVGWAILVTALLITLAMIYSSDKSLRKAVLAGDFERVYASAALKEFSKWQDVGESKILKDFAANWHRLYRRSQTHSAQPSRAAGSYIHHDGPFPIYGSAA